ncbi:MAG TPA: VanW family protein [Candidatus Limnocylindria bacterium]|jgi:vancomycin resistance protein YoaR
MTTLTALARPVTLLHAGSPRRGFLLGFLGTLLLGLALLAAVSIAVSVAHAGRIMPGVRVGGVEVGGLDRSAAASRLAAELPSLTSGTLAITIGDETVAVPLSQLGRRYDTDRMLSQAYGVARSGDLVADAIARLRVLAVSSSLPSSVAGDGGTAVDAVAADLVSRFAATASDASITHTEEGGFAVAAGVVGMALDADELRTALRAVVAAGAEAPTSVAIEPVITEPDVTTREAEIAARQANRIAAEPLTLRGGGKSFKLSVPSLAGLIGFTTLADGAYAPTIDEEGLAELVRPLARKVRTAPQNASFTWGPGGITGVVPAVEGRKLDVQASLARIGDALRDRGNAVVRRSIPFAIVASTPALTTRAAEAAAPKMQRLNTWTTYYVPGEGNFWNANIHIPAWDLDGKVIAPGEWFEFWQGIGPVTLARGYGYGGAIINGRSVPNGALAGGICSTSTTLFNAAMRSGLEIGERTNHSYYIERYPVGLDATVLKTDTWETDMTFRNDTENPIVIRSYTGNGWVRFDIWGVPDGRRVQLSNPATSGHRSAVWTTVVNPNLAPGTSRIVEYPHDGFFATVTRWVYDRDGNLLHENVWHSPYRTVNGITEVGPRR